MVSYPDNWRESHFVDPVLVRFPPAPYDGWVPQAGEIVEAQAADSAGGAEPVSWWRVQIMTVKGEFYLVQFLDLKTPYQEVYEKDLLRPYNPNPALSLAAIERIEVPFPEGLQPADVDAAAVTRAQHESSVLSVALNETSTGMLALGDRAALQKFAALMSYSLVMMQQLQHYTAAHQRSQHSLQDFQQTYAAMLERVIHVEPELIGLVIGKQGANIKLAKANEGVATINVGEDGAVSIRGTSEAGLQAAAEMLEIVRRRVEIPALALPALTQQNIATIEEKAGNVKIRVLRDDGSDAHHNYNNNYRGVHQAQQQQQHALEQRAARNPEALVSVVLVGRVAAVELAIALVNETVGFARIFQNMRAETHENMNKVRELRSSAGIAYASDRGSNNDGERRPYRPTANNYLGAALSRAGGRAPTTAAAVAAANNNAAAAAAGNGNGNYSGYVGGGKGPRVAYTSDGGHARRNESGSGSNTSGSGPAAAKDHKGGNTKDFKEQGQGKGEQSKGRQSRDQGGHKKAAQDEHINITVGKTMGKGNASTSALAQAFVDMSNDSSKGGNKKDGNKKTGDKASDVKQQQQQQQQQKAQGQAQGKDGKQKQQMQQQEQQGKKDAAAAPAAGDAKKDGNKQGNKKNQNQNQQNDAAKDATATSKDGAAAKKEHVKKDDKTAAASKDGAAKDAKKSDQGSEKKQQDGAAADGNNNGNKEPQSAKKGRPATAKATPAKDTAAKPAAAAATDAAAATATPAKGAAKGADAKTPKAAEAKTPKAAAEPKDAATPKADAQGDAAPKTPKGKGEAAAKAPKADAKAEDKAEDKADGKKQQSPRKSATPKATTTVAPAADADAAADASASAPAPSASAAASAPSAASSVAEAVPEVAAPPAAIPPPAETPASA